MNKKHKIELPAIGSEQLVDICPWNDETWMAFGRLLFTWHDSEACDRVATESEANEEDDTWAVIQITRAMTADENPDGWQSDGSWNTSIGVAYRKDYLNHRNEWRAEYPANDRARELWGTGDDEVHSVDHNRQVASREELADEGLEPCIVCGEPCDMRVGYEGDRCMGCEGAVCNCECMHHHHDEGCEG